jgi:hypothetical protein
MPLGVLTLPVEAGKSLPERREYRESIETMLPLNRAHPYLGSVRFVPIRTG